MSVHLKNNTAYLTGNGGKKICTVFSENVRDMASYAYHDSTYVLVCFFGDNWAFFTSLKG